MLAAATTKYGYEAYQFKEQATEGFARLVNNAEAEGRTEEAYAWGDIVNRVGAITDAWRNVIASYEPRARKDSIAPEEAVLLLRRRHRR